MEKSIIYVPLELPNIKSYKIPTKTKNINITQMSNDTNISRETSDPASFSSSPPSDFVKFLKQRIAQY